MSSKKYKIKSRIWIEGKIGTFLAEGRVALLKKIIEHGSISKAAKEMNMSYSKAWEQLNNMNQSAGKPLIIKVSGGKNGGGSEVTEYGKKMIAAFDTLTENCRVFMDNELKKMEL